MRPYLRVKRLTDVLFAATLLVALSPLLLILALAIRIALGPPVIYRQTRVGKGGRLFALLKFRTMRDEYDGNGTPKPDELRLTRLGRSLRAASLDELPQLVNVMRGDMALVGPRPLLPEYLARYSPRQARRHEVRPGITGLSQVRGRNALRWSKRLALDVWYVDHLSARVDAYIMWRTLVSLVRRDGIAAPGHATMPPFLGRPEARPS